MTENTMLELKEFKKEQMRKLNHSMMIYVPIVAFIITILDFYFQHTQVIVSIILFMFLCIIGVIFNKLCE